MKSIAFSLLMLSALTPLELTAGQAPTSPNGAVFVAYYWRAKPGQLEAYNRHDLEAFLAAFAPNVRMYSRDGSVMSGRRTLRETYGPRLATGRCRAEIVNRIAEGNWVVDQEIAHGIEPQPIRVLAAYRVVEGLIAEVRFLV